IAGQSVTTSSNTEQPKPTNETAKISAAPPSLNKPIFIQAENLGENGISQAVKDSVTQAGLSNIVGFGNLNNQVDTPIDTSEPTTESQSDILINGTGLSNANFNYLLTGGTLASNANNNLSTYQSEAFDLQLISANLYDFYSDEFVTMGRAKGKVNNQNVDSLNYIAGNATQPANLLQLANLNGSANFSNNATITSNLNNIGCLAGCNGLLSDADGNNASVVGRLIGPNAERAGIQYGFTAGNSNLESVSGSVVMQQQ
ncbi:MAG: hypothetical protein B7Y32_07365, partial [Methylophilales bacterium 16-45-7]